MFRVSVVLMVCEYCVCMLWRCECRVYASCACIFCVYFCVFKLSVLMFCLDDLRAYVVCVCCVSMLCVW